VSTEVATALAVAVGGLIPVAVAGTVRLLDWWRGRKREAFQQGRQLRRDQIAAYDEMFALMRSDLDEKAAQIASQGEKLDAAAAREAECGRRLSRCEARLEYYEAAMLSAGVKFRPWSEAAGEGPHP
jgi:hypothetical protein